MASSPETDERNNIDNEKDGKKKDAAKVDSISHDDDPIVGRELQDDKDDY